MLLLATLFNAHRVSLVTFPTVKFDVSVVFDVVFSLTLGSTQGRRNSFTKVLYSTVTNNTNNPVVIDALTSTASLHANVLDVLVFIKCVAFVNF